MATKPTDLPEWASDPGADITEPDAAKQQLGWIVEAPPHDFFNWWQNLVYLWVLYLDDLAAQPFFWTAAHHFSSDVVFDAAGDVTFEGGATFLAEATFPASSPTAIGAGTGGSLGTNWALAAVGLQGRSYPVPGREIALTGAIETTGAPGATAFTLATAIRPLAGQRSFRIVGERAAAQVPCFLNIVASTGAVQVTREDGAALASGDKFFLDGVRWTTSF